MTKLIIFSLYLGEIKRGTILKGKKLVYKSIIVLTAILCGLLCLGLGLNLGRKKGYAVAVHSTDQFSQVDENNLVLSVEKVAVISANDFSTDLTDDANFKTPLFDRDGNKLNSMLVSNASADGTIEAGSYYYQDIVNGTSAKHVVYNGEFVKLNNTKYGDLAYNPRLGNAYDGASVQHHLSEAVMVSFGKYVIDDDDGYHVVDSETATPANIQTINVVVRKDGEIISVPGVRNNVGNTSQDFACIIPQAVGNDGYYEFTISYFFDGRQCEQTFAFYVLFNSSYETVEVRGGNAYSSRPSIDGASTINDVYQHFIGKDASNLDYPTLTFDYTKFRVGYTHTANGRVTTYNYSLVKNGRYNASLVCSVTSMGETTTITYPMTNYDVNSEFNLVTIMLTEVGNYNVYADYIYSGYNPLDQSEMIVENIEIPNQALVIHGFELKYSKVGNLEAQMRYLTISSNADDRVDLIVPNGYRNGTNPEDEKLGFVYDLLSKPSDHKRVGGVVDSLDANLNPSKLSPVSVDGTPSSAVSYLVNKITNGEVDDNIAKILSEIDANNLYVKTNQSSLWLDSNDNYVENDSFYYYSPTPIRVNDGKLTAESEKFNNATSFANPGYYLAFIKVDANNFSDGSYDYYQVFAFQYTTDTITINVNEYDSTKPDGIGKPVGSNKFTNKAVIVTYEEPGIFEYKVNARYYSILNRYYTEQELLATPVHAFNNGDIIGANVGDNQGASFLIELSSVGQTRPRYMFTIDRQHITGVGAYQVSAGADTNNARVFEFKTSESGEPIKITNSITNSYTSVFWNDKPSGVGINASYTFTPFVRNGKGIGEINSWFTTNYELGKTVGSFEDIDKAQSLYSEISSKDVLYRQGIYVFTLTDLAGNSTKFMFVIDDTEGYFKLTEQGSEISQYASQTSSLFSTNTTVTLGTHKVFELVDNSLATGEQSAIRSELTGLINLASNPSATVQMFRQLGYYAEADTNALALKNLFTSLGDKVYLTVKNNSLTAYTSEDALDSTNSISNITTNNRSATVRYVGNGATSTIRSLYLLGENQRNLPAKSSDSYVVVEVNPDNSRSMVYYSNNAFTLSDVPMNGADSSDVRRLTTGSDVSGKSGIELAHATSDKFVGLVWNVGTGAYEVESIKYDFYQLELNEDSFGDKYYYKKVRSDVSLFDGSYNGISTDEFSRAYVQINVENNQTVEGLYVVTRKYKEVQGANLGQDNLSQTYYFIVDRNEIIDRGNALNGGYISVNLKENETNFNEFNAINLAPQYFSYYEDNVIKYNNKLYNLYLTTDKLPATISVPTSKYFGGANGSKYYAGRLQFELFYKDYRSQISNQMVIKLFDGEIDLNDNSDYFAINFEDYLTEAEREKFIREGNMSNWICLPGDYILVIKDTVEGFSSHEKLIGFRVEESTPNLDVYSASSREGEASNSLYTAKKVDDCEFYLTTSEEFVKIDMPPYLTEDIKANIDLNYLVVTQTLDGRQTYYIRHEYSNMGGTNSLNDSNPTVVQNKYVGSTLSSRTIYLQTYLRDDLGNIIEENVNRQLYYDVYIRYNLTGKIDTATQNERYKNCYYYYDVNGNLQTYFETHYRIVIDRVAPTDNVNNITSSDALVDFYNAENGTEMFEDSYHQTNSNVYFVRQYAKYYQTNDLSHIYAIGINETTAFDSSDVSRLYFRELDPNQEITLELPIINFSRYNAVNVDRINSSTYSSFLHDNYGRYFEIIEQDEAGNTTQYVVYYANTSSAGDNFGLRLNANLSSGGAISLEDIDLSISGNRAQYTLFDLTTNVETGSVIERTSFSDLFYRISLTSTITGRVYYIQTNFATDFTAEGLATDIVNMIKSAGQGNYILELRSRIRRNSYTINYYDENNKVELSAANLVRVLQDAYQINLNGANVTHNGIMYYAARVEVTHDGITDVYTCNPSDNFSYENANGESFQVLAGLSGTYHIRIYDAFGDASTYRFNTEGKDYHTISFGEDGTGESYYDIVTDTYYAFNNANITFDSSLYNVNIETTLNGSNRKTVYYPYDGATNSIVYNDIVVVEIVDGSIRVNPYWGANELGGLLNVNVEFSFDDEVEGYKVCLDTRMAVVSLTTESKTQQLTVYNNMPYDDERAVSKNGTSGTTTLAWGTITNSQFNYQYTLYELLLSGDYRSTNLDGVNYSVINTQPDSTGVYKFEIAVFSSDGKKLGNKLYVFNVQTNSIEDYTVKLGGEEIKVNSEFTFEETGDEVTIANRLSRQNETLRLPTGRHPLYIVNEIPEISVASSRGMELLDPYENGLLYGDGNVLRIYRVYSPTYSSYFGVLIVRKTDKLIENVRLNQELLEEENGGFTFTRAGLKNQTFTLTLGKPSTNETAIALKNVLKLDVYNNDELVTTKELVRNGDKFDYVIQGNGRYSFVVKDLANNTHVFETRHGAITDRINLVILREVVVEVNDNAPVDSAYYNGTVRVRVVTPSTYVLGSLSISATRNGNAYTPANYQYEYTFTDYGNYRVILNAQYRDNRDGTVYDLRKVILFTIVNEREARSSIDLTSVGAYSITNVTNPQGLDVTDAFKQLINVNNSSMLLTYDMLVANADKLGISSGKQSFTMTYVVEDEVYPTRVVTFTFTMNNEQPTIECSLAPGESSSKNFSLSFNPGIIYQQIGDAYLFINDTLVYTVDENSGVGVVEATFSEKDYGAGNYYVRLQSASGQVITSFKVTLKEPLNSWAIIIIVVVTVVVVAIVVSIILLRRKMRIR